MTIITRYQVMGAVMNAKSKMGFIVQQLKDKNQNVLCHHVEMVRFYLQKLVTMEMQLMGLDENLTVQDL